jgi:hypothetical protein
LRSRGTTSPEQAKASLAYITHAANVLAPSARHIKTINNREEKTMKQPNKPRTHLFSPYTDLCIYCGNSAQDNAIENTPCGSDQPISCGACDGKGWLWRIGQGDHPSREEIQRCDACQNFATDQAALEAVVEAAESQPALLKFVEQIDQELGARERTKDQT